MDAVDHAILAAARRRWEATQLPAITDRLPGAGRLHSPADQPLPAAYGQTECQYAKHERYNKAVIKDTRRLTLRVYGPKDRAAAGLVILHAAFSERMGDGTHEALTLPDGWLFTCIRHERPGTLTLDDNVRAGQDIWRAELVCLVTFSRPEG